MHVESISSEPPAGLTLTRVKDAPPARTAAKNKENADPRGDRIAVGKGELCPLNARTPFSELRALQERLPENRRAPNLAAPRRDPLAGHIHEHVPGERTDAQQTRLIRERLARSELNPPRYSYFLDRPTAQGCVDVITLRHHADFARLDGQKKFDVKFKENVGRIITPVRVKDVQGYVDGATADAGRGGRTLKNISAKPALITNKLRRLRSEGVGEGDLYLIAETSSARLVHDGVRAVTAYPIVDGAKATNLIRASDLGEHVARMRGAGENAPPADAPRPTQPRAAYPTPASARRPLGERNLRA